MKLFLMLVCIISVVPARITPLEASHLTDEDRIPFNVDLEYIFLEGFRYIGTSPYNQADTSGSTAVVKFTVPPNTDIACYIAECISLNDETMFLGMKFGSIQTSLSDGESKSFTTCPTDMKVNSESNTDLYLMLTFIGSDGGPVQMTAVCFANPSAPDSAPAPTCQCFSEQSTVEVADKGTVVMRDLQVNDQVLVGSKDGKPVYEPVYAFGHYNQATPTEYLKIHTKSSPPLDPLEISRAHLLYVDGKDHPVRADSIQPGNALLMKTTNTPATTAVVTKIEIVTRTGAYMPLTQSGYIVVNGILASDYVSSMAYAPRAINMYLGLADYSSFLFEHQLLHWWLAPYRMVCLGISPKLCKNDRNEEGIIYWLLILRYCARLSDAGGLPIQIIGLFSLVLLLASFIAAETLFFSFGGLAGSSFALVCFLVAKKSTYFTWKSAELKTKVE